jgi:hypothetical protein
MMIGTTGSVAEHYSPTSAKVDSANFAITEFSDFRMQQSSARKRYTLALHTSVSSAVDEAFTAAGQPSTVSSVMSKPSATL